MRSASQLYEHLSEAYLREIEELLDIAGMSTYSTRPERPSSTPESSPGTEPILRGRNPLTPDEWIVDVIYHDLQDHYPSQAN